METIYRGGRPIAGYGIGGPPQLSECAKRKILDIESRHAIGTGDANSGEPGGTVAAASLMAGAAAGLLVHVLRAPLWASILSGVGAAYVTKVGIERA